MDYDIVRWYNANAHRRVGGASSSRPTSRADGATGSRALSPILNDPSLTRGERRYLNSIAKIYSVDNMRQQKQVQYNKLMWKEIRKGQLGRNYLFYRACAAWWLLSALDFAIQGLRVRFQSHIIIVAAFRKQFILCGKQESWKLVGGHIFNGKIIFLVWL